MIKHRLLQKPAFDVIGKKTWISGQDNELFGRFWVDCQKQGLFELFEQLRGNQPGTQTKSSVLGISCVEQDPLNRAFYYMIAIEKPEKQSTELELYHIPESHWAVFECDGKVPASIVESEIYAFAGWLPASGYEHARAPEMEVYFAGNDGASENNYCEFWLPITASPTQQFDTTQSNNGSSN
jgi:AraC family transcriptional regulator